MKTVRNDFAPLREQPDLVYLDSAATSLKPDAVVEAILDYYRAYPANVHRAFHRLSARATDAFEEARNRVAQFIGADSREIIFTRGTTEGINLAAQGWGETLLGDRSVVLVSEMEHHSNLVPWQMLAQRCGCELRFIPVLPNGELDQASLEERLDEKVALVAVTAVSNVLGTVNPVRAIARQAHAVGARVLVDAAQAAPHMMIDVVDWDCDIAVFSGHKMMGPTGIGVLYARSDLLEAMPPWMGGGEMINTVTRETATWADLPYRMEAGTPNVAGAIGLGAAVEYLAALGRDSLQAHDQALLALARNRLTAIDGVTVVGHPDRAAGLVSFAVEGVHPHDMAQVADEIGVAIRAGSMCAQPLMHALGYPALSRASFGPYTSESDIDQLVSAVQQAMEFFA